jgi:ferrous iron transport protein A
MLKNAAFRWHDDCLYSGEGEKKGMMANQVQARTAETQQTIPLNYSPPGQWLKIISMPRGIIFTQFVRFGINEGEKVKCIERLPGGTIVLQKNRQQIAIGHNLAKQVFVVFIDAAGE